MNIFLNFLLSVFIIFILFFTTFSKADSGLTDISFDSLKNPVIILPDTLKSGEEYLLRKMPYIKNKRDIPTEEKYCIIRLTGSNDPPAARPVIEIEESGEKFFREFEYVKCFDLKEDALEYANKNGITNIEIEDK